MKKHAFKATIEKGYGGGAYVLFPYDVEKAFGTDGKVPVRVTFDGVPDRGALIKYGQPQHILGVPKAIRDQIGKAPGARVDVVLWRDDEIRKVEVPPQFARLMQQEGVRAIFDKLSYSHRKEYCRWIGEAKKDETRERRLAKSVEMLRNGVRTPG